MTIVYVAHIRLPTEKAHGLQIMKTCEAFARLGHTVTLLVPTRRTPIREDPFAYYGVAPLFTIVSVPLPDIAAYGRLGFLISAALFGRRARALVRALSPQILYSRDELPLYLASAGVSCVCWEAHTGTWNMVVRALVTNGVRVVAISEGLKRWYRAQGVPDHAMCVAHDGIDLADFEPKESQAAARARLGLPTDAPIVMYAGRLDGWKGVDTLLRAATLLPPAVVMVVIGGTEAEVHTFAARYQSIRFLGSRPYRELARNLAAADVVVLPNTGTQTVSRYYTSPLKLFAYMASGKPMVVSDLPSIREVVTEASAVLVEPDSPEALAAGILRLLEDPSYAATLAACARTQVRHFTWTIRAERILSFLSL